MSIGSEVGRGVEHQAGCQGGHHVGVGEQHRAVGEVSEEGSGGHPACASGTVASKPFDEQLQRGAFEPVLRVRLQRPMRLVMDMVPSAVYGVTTSRVSSGLRGISKGEYEQRHLVLLRPVGRGSPGACARRVTPWCWPDVTRPGSTRPRRNWVAPTSYPARSSHCSRSCGTQHRESWSARLARSPAPRHRSSTPARRGRITSTSAMSSPASVRSSTGTSERSPMAGRS